MDVRMPDGTLIRNVPEGTTKAQLQAKLDRRGSTASAPRLVEQRAQNTVAPESPAAIPQTSTANNSVRALARGVPIIGSFLDEANAATNAALDPYIGGLMGGPRIPGGNYSERYDNALAMQRGMDRQFDAERPIASTAAPAVGSAALGLVGSKAPLAAKVAAGAASGAGIGYAHGFGAGEGEQGRRDNAGISAGIGGVLGGAVPAVSQAIGRGVDAIRGRGMPALDNMAASASAAYREAEQSGVRLSNQAWRSAVDKINSAINRTLPDGTPEQTAVFRRAVGAGDDPILRTVDAMQETAQRGDEMGLIGLDRLRQIVAGNYKANPRLAVAVRNAIDDVIDGIDDSQVVGGMSERGRNALLSARQQTRTLKKTEIINDAIENVRINAQARGTVGSGQDTAMRNAFAAIKKNKDQWKQFSSEEQAAITRAIGGGPIQTVLRLLGRLSPVTSNANAGILSAMGIGAAGTLNLPLAAGMAAATMGAKELSRGLTYNNAAAVNALVRTGARNSPLAGQITNTAQSLLFPSIPAALPEQQTGGLLGVR